MKRVILGLIVFAGLWLYNGGFAQITGGSGIPGSAAAQGDPIEPFSDEDQEMNAAMAQAQTTLPLFLKNNTDADGNSIGNVSIKVAFDTNSGPEIIWVGPFQWDGTLGLTGLLRNQPNYIVGLNAGDRVDFTTTMVRDWSVIRDDGTMFGNYTTRVMLPYIDPETATYLRNAISPDPVPTDWN